MRTLLFHPASAYDFLTLLLSWSYQAYLIASDGLGRLGLPALLVLMWIPGLVAIGFKLARREPIWSRTAKQGALSSYAFAIGLPLGLALAVGLVSVPLGLRVFRPLEVSVILSKSGAISLVLFLGIIGAAGEELGWRGYLLPKLRESGVGRPFLLSGLVWALWHLPLVTLGGYYPGSHPAAIALSYTLSIIAIGTVIGEALLRTGRLGVAIALHAAHNFFFQLAVPRLVFSEAGPHARWWDFLGSDCGLLVALAYGTVTLSRCVRRSSR